MRYSFACRLTSKELLLRRKGIINQLKENVLERKELQNGYSYTFPGNDASLSLITEFILSERLCCDFFNYNLRIKDENNPAILDITGEDGIKNFIDQEIGL